MPIFIDNILLLMKKCVLLGLVGLVFSSCNSKSDEPNKPDIDIPSISSETLYVVNAGRFNYSNASITKCNQDGIATNEVFYKANGFKLGDVAQSATVYNDKVWIVVNNSNVIFAVDKNTFKEVGRIDKNLLSPRYIHFVSEDKAYVSQMYSSKIAIVDPRLYTVKGYIDVPEGANGISVGSTEEMVQVGDYVFVNLWSYDNRILKIDTKTDTVVDDLTVGIQPNSLVVDKNFDLWTLCDGGGWEENPAGYESPRLLCIDVKDMKVKSTYSFALGNSMSKLSIDGSGSILYWINNKFNGIGDNVGGVYKMSINSNSVPSNAFVASNGKYFYSMTISPLDGDLFVADALDYDQPGVVYHYSSEGDLIGHFEAGVIPTAYAWVLK